MDLQCSLAGMREVHRGCQQARRYNVVVTSICTSGTLLICSILSSKRVGSTPHECFLHAGKVLDVKFLDVEVAQAQITWGHLIANGTSTPPPRAEAVAILRCIRLVVIVCEAKVLLHDLTSKRTQVGGCLWMHTCAW